MSEVRPMGLFDIDPANYGTQQGNNALEGRGIHANTVPSDADNRISEEEMLRHYPTRDEKVYKLLEVARTIAPTKVPILITGESGTGKETFAKAIHIAGGRERGRFIVANSSNIPANFFEMELFAVQRNQHDFNQIPINRPLETCSLMLDEVTELDASMQLKLLRILKEQDVNKGAIRKGTASDARIIACSNKNIQDEVNAQRFRNDLFFKLHVIHLELPALRQRLVDIDFYSEIFLREFNIQFSKNVQLSPTAKQALRTYTWPGNTRELRNVVQRSVLLSTRDYIGVEELHLMRANSRTEVAMGDPLPQVTLMELEQRLILQTLRRMNGNRTHTAKALGISLRALRYKLNELVECGYEVEGKKYMSTVIGNQIFGKPDAVLEESLNQRLKRQSVNVSNVTNSLTPGYRALGFEFEKQLQAAIGSDKDLIMKVSDPRHIKAPGMGADGVLKPDLFVKPTESIGNDGNTVDVDQEMTEMAGNQVIYKATIETLNRKLGMLRYAINGGR